MNHANTLHRLWLTLLATTAPLAGADAELPYPDPVPCTGPTYQVRDHHGAPTFFIDDRPVLPVFAQPQNWAQPGYPRIHDGAVVLTDDPANQPYVQRALQTSNKHRGNLSVSATVGVQAGHGSGHGASIVAGDGAAGHYALGMYESSAGPVVRLMKFDARRGEYAQQVEQPLSWRSGEAHVLRLEASGQEIVGFVDGKEVARLSDSEPLGDGFVKLQAYQCTASFDDVHIQDASGEVFADDFETARPWDWNGTPLQDAKDFKDIGIHMYTSAAWGGMYGGWSGHMLGPDNKYDSSKVDSTIAEMLKRDPDSLFLPRVYLQPPTWWLEAHPEEAMKLQWLNDPTLSPYKYASFTSKAWVEEASQFLRQYIRHLNSSDYGDRVIGFTLMNGNGGEWVYSFEPYYFDYSTVQQDAYRQWLRERYGDVETLRKAWNDPSAAFETAVIPSPQDKTRAYDFEFRDPEKARHITDYMKFHAVSVTEAIDTMARVVKEETEGKKIVIVFYGYLSYLNRFPKSLESGHMAYDRFVTSPLVDGVGSLHPYEYRNANVTLSTTPVDSASLYGKILLYESDPRTHLGPHNLGLGQTLTMTDTVNDLKRNFAYYLSKHGGYWYMDWSNGWFHDDRIMDLLGQMKALSDQSLEKDRRKNDEIAVVISGRSSDFVRNSPNLLYDLVTRQYYEELSKIGAPFGAYHLEALEKMPDHKLYIFLNAFYLTDDDKAMIDAKVKRNNATVLWMYAPGYVSDTGLSTSGIEEVTGINIQRLNMAGKLVATVKADSSIALPGVPEGLAWGHDEAVMVYDAERAAPVQSPEAVLGPIFYAADDSATRMATLHATELVNPEGNAVDRRLQLPGMVQKNFDDWTSIWCGVPNIPVELLRAIARNAGVHIYADENDTVYANRFMLAIQAAEAGERVVPLPEPMRVTDAYSGHVLAEQSDRFTVTLNKGETGMWFLEPAQQTDEFTSQP